MELYLHAGLNKTGSSYLQEMFYANSDSLGAESISYLGGERPGGNAAELSYAIRRNDRAGAMKLMRQHFNHASQAGCKKILLSTEIFFHDFAVKERFELLCSIIREVGVKNIHILLFFREPVSHAISTYCHRNGLQEVGEFEEWLEQKYTYPNELSSFLQAYESSTDIKWSLKAYTNSALKADTCDWLEIADMEEPLKDEVNVSVTATEAVILEKLYQLNPERSKELRASFKAIPRAQKASDKVLRSQWQHVAASNLVKYQSEFERLSELVGEPLGVKEPSEAKLDNPETIDMVFSSSQMQEVIELCGSKTPKFSPIGFLKSFRRKLLRIRRFGL